VTVIWPALLATERKADFRNPGGASRWHTDLVHERQPAGITHLHNDTIPSIGGDTLWVSFLLDIIMTFCQRHGRF
jgi:alpha-ketoglutarate-dependent taurine dioxygenase